MTEQKAKAKIVSQKMPPVDTTGMTNFVQPEPRTLSSRQRKEGEMEVKYIEKSDDNIVVAWGWPL